jgi:flagellar protein FlaC
MPIKLKMGKPGGDSTENSNVGEVKEGQNFNDASNVKAEQSTENTPEKNGSPKENKGKIEDVESLRKVIKLDSSNKEDEKEKDNEDSSPDQNSSSDENQTKEDEADTTDSSSIETLQEQPTSSLGREALEQRRAVLQSIKDFDFQIKKNRDDIGNITKKMDALSKDLDDLVSLYEIVSEQMNPFVGISKVTKKRLDMLENFTKSIDELRQRLDTIESGGIMIQHPVISDNKDISDQLSDNELDKIIEMSIGQISVDNKIDNIIDEFIETLKIENLNRV